MAVATATVSTSFIPPVSVSTDDLTGAPSVPASLFERLVKAVLRPQVQIDVAGLGTYTVGKKPYPWPVGLAVLLFLVVGGALVVWHAAKRVR